jgi:hypothetical protein
VVSNLLFAAIWWAMSGVAVVMLRRTSSRVSRRLAAIERTPTSAIAQAPRDGTVEIVGRVVASERGVVQAPASNRPAVYARTLVERVNGSSRDTVLDDLLSRPFLVDDGSGATAWVEIDDRAHVAVDPSRLTGDDAESARIGGLLMRNGIMDSPKKLVWREWLIEAGADVYVLGEASAMAAGPSQTQYRDQPRDRLRITPPSANTGPEMLVSTHGEAGLVGRLTGQRTMFRFAVGFVVALAIVVSFFLSMH